MEAVDRGSSRNLTKVLDSAQPSRILTKFHSKGPHKQHTNICISEIWTKGGQVET